LPEPSNVRDRRELYTLTKYVQRLHTSG
jgi:hypothetical protein